MHKDLANIQKYSVTVLGNYPEQKETLKSRMHAAEEVLKTAKDELDKAEDIESYDRATEAIRRAELEVKFAKNALDKLSSAPRMNEKEYMQNLNVCREIMEDAVKSYRKKAKALMDQLKTVTDEYKQTAEDVNTTLVKLDEAANVLQCKYPYRVERRNKLPDVHIPDKKAWEKAALRYDGYRACTLATEARPEDNPRPRETHNSVLCAAWGAIQKGYPAETY